MLKRVVGLVAVLMIFAVGCKRSSEEYERWDERHWTEGEELELRNESLPVQRRVEDYGVEFNEEILEGQEDTREAILE